MLHHAVCASSSVAKQLQLLAELSQNNPSHFIYISNARVCLGVSASSGWDGHESNPCDMFPICFIDG